MPPPMSTVEASNQNVRYDLVGRRVHIGTGVTRLGLLTPSLEDTRNSTKWHIGFLTRSRLQVGDCFSRSCRINAICYSGL